MEPIWKDRKRSMFFGLPWSFTKYALDEEKLYIKTGVFTVFEDEVRLYRISDLTLRRSFGQRLLGLGTIHCCSSDASMQEFDVKNIKNSRKVKDLMSGLIEEERMRKRVYSRESLTVHTHDDHDEFGGPEHDDDHDHDHGIGDLDHFHDDDFHDGHHH